MWPARRSPRARDQPQDRRRWASTRRAAIAARRVWSTCLCSTFTCFRRRCTALPTCASVGKCARATCCSPCETRLEVDSAASEPCGHMDSLGLRSRTPHFWSGHEQTQLRRRALSALRVVQHSVARTLFKWANGVGKVRSSSTISSFVRRLERSRLEPAAAAARGVQGLTIFVGKLPPRECRHPRPRGSSGPLGFGTHRWASTEEAPQTAARGRRSVAPAKARSTRRRRCGIAATVAAADSTRGPPPTSARSTWAWADDDAVAAARRPGRRRRAAVEAAAAGRRRSWDRRQPREERDADRLIIDAGRTFRATPRAMSCSGGGGLGQLEARDAYRHVPVDRRRKANPVTASCGPLCVTGREPAGACAWTSPAAKDVPTTALLAAGSAPPPAAVVPPPPRLPADRGEWTPRGRDGRERLHGVGPRGGGQGLRPPRAHRAPRGDRAALVGSQAALMGVVMQIAEADWEVAGGERAPCRAAAPGWFRGQLVSPHLLRMSTSRAFSISTGAGGSSSRPACCTL